MMDYNGLYRDLMAMRQRAHADGDWARFGNGWKQLAHFINEIDEFVDDLDRRDWSEVN